ncbi:KOW domain-containing RNA-binding protein [Ruminococcaceae bacterium OttesenSCG-928-A16]|nr:KOW domain-containing RNA-binding protein [Ruminococcaceae bacterium OttesenSCG-928-A16]
MKLEVGQIVMSRAGRDVTRYYVVVQVAQSRVLLANGSKYTLQAPKGKNIRHISPTKTVLTPSDMQTDDQLKQALAVYNQNRAAQMQGG